MRAVWVLGVLLLGTAAAAADTRADSAVDEQADVRQWRAARVAELTSQTGWLTLAGLYWLEPGANSFGRASTNTLVLNHPDLAEHAGIFKLENGHVRFDAHPDSGVTHAGEPVTQLDLLSDAQTSPTVMSSGSLRFFIIERAGKLAVRVRDVRSQRRRDFRGLDYFPIDTQWALTARFEPYEPHRHIRIVNILGMEEELESPGALVFDKDGHQWRLDALLEQPDDPDLFVMFADGTSGRETYGAGRFLRVAFAREGHTRLDFNKSYNPPCAFNDFATCPLPPPQNRLTLPVTAGERKYSGGR